MQNDVRQRLSAVRQALDQLDAAMHALAPEHALDPPHVGPLLGLASAIEPADVVRVAAHAGSGLPGSAGAMCLRDDKGALSIGGVWDNGQVWLASQPAQASSLPDRIAARSLDTALRLPLNAHGVQAGELRVWGDPARIGDGARLLCLCASMALAGLTLKQRLNQRMARDPLTGLFNQRYFEDTLGRELHRAQRHASSICVILIDLDDFTGFNRRFGNEQGDRMLQAVAGTLQSSFRGSDVCCRMHGQRFALLLPDASVADAERRARELVAAIAALRVGRQADGPATITACAGLAGSPLHANDRLSLLDGAEAALYLAKQGGAGSVSIAERPV